MQTQDHPWRGLDGAISRRRWFGAAAGAGLFWIAPRHVLGGAKSQPPSERLNLAGVGLGAMGVDNLKHCEGANVVALCDVDWTAAATAFQRYPKAAKYRDYRRMLDRQRDIDAVIVAAPDHAHAVITAAAMKRGKHVYTQMPLAHDVWEARELARIARQTGVVTQMGNDVHSGPGVRRVCEWVWNGDLGAVREARGWTHWPEWPQGIRRPAERPPTPPGLDWDLWIGPAPLRPYHPAYHPYLWRGWRDFGTGALGAMGCHILDAPFWALKLQEADRFTIEANSEGLQEETWPIASTIRYSFPARGDMPPVAVTWYDGGRRPPRPVGWPAAREMVGGDGVLLIGDKCTMAFGGLTAGTHPGQAGPRLIPETKMASPPPRMLPRVANERDVGRHEQEWLEACKTGRQPCSHFEYAAALTEMVLLGDVALLSDGPIEWDRRRMKVINQPEANRWIRREYRSGWSL